MPGINVSNQPAVHGAPKKIALWDNDPNKPEDGNTPPPGTYQPLQQPNNVKYANLPEGKLRLNFRTRDNEGHILFGPNGAAIRVAPKDYNYGVSNNKAFFVIQNKKSGQTIFFRFSDGKIQVPRNTNPLRVIPNSIIQNWGTENIDGLGVAK